MSQEQLLTDESNWYRKGRGLALQFFATDEEIQNWLVEALPVEYQPYKILRVEPVREGRSGIERVFQCEVGAFLYCLNLSDTPIQCWIWSQTLSPTLPVTTAKRLGALYSLNGLVILQHRRLIRPKVPPEPDIARYYQPSMIGIVNKVAHFETGTVIIHSSYLNIYNALKKRIQKALVYTTVMRGFPEDEQITSLVRMTEGAVQAYQEGVPYFYIPGHFIGKAKKD